LILAPAEFRVIQTCDIYLHILNHDGTDWKGKALNHSNDFLHIGLDRRGKPPTPLAGCAIEKSARPIPASCPAAFAPLPPIMQLFLHIPAVVDLCREQGYSVAYTGKACNTASLIDSTDYLLGVLLALPMELDREGAIPHNFRFLCL